jgi:hypothetical protein
MERGSTKHSARLDDEMQHEIEGAIRSGQPNRVEPHRETEAVLPEPDEPLGQPDESRYDTEISRSKRR